MQAFCQFLVRNKFMCLHSTSPNEDFQPGVLQVKWVVQHLSDHTAANSANVSDKDRVADVVVYHVQKEYFTIIVESDMKDVTSQNMEQMIGLFHPTQYVMLGLTVYPTKTKVTPRSAKELEVIKLTCMVAGKGHPSQTSTLYHFRLPLW